MTTNQLDAGQQDRDAHDDVETPDAANTTIAGDTTIIEGNPEPPVRGPGGEMLHVLVGAQVYSSDGDAVAVVEITNADSIGIRAGQPGRSIVVPASGIARVSPDGKRVDLFASAAKVRDLSGAEQPGAKHLEAQQPQTLARDDQAGATTAHDERPVNTADAPAGIVGPAQDGPPRPEAH